MLVCGMKLSVLKMFSSKEHHASVPFTKKSVKFEPKLEIILQMSNSNWFSNLQLWV